MLKISILLLVFVMVAGHAAAQQSRSASDFALHGGPVYARVSDAEFEPVVALSGQELFALAEENESRADFAVFVSQRLAGSTDEVRAYATIGTGLHDPGGLLLFGGSVAFSRVLATVGVATAQMREGVQPVPDQVFRGTADRTLFGGLQEMRSWGMFFAVSVAVVQ